MADLAAEAAQLRLKVLALGAENERLRETISFQLGNAILQVRSLRGLMDLPGALWALRRQSQQRRGRGRGAGRSSDFLDIDPARAERIRRLSARVLELPVDEMAAAAIRECRNERTAARLIADLAASVQPVDFERSVALARRTVDIDDSPHRKAWLANFLFQAGMIEEPRRLFREMAQSKDAMPSSAQRKQALVEGMARVRDQGLAVPPRQAPVGAHDRSLLYVAASSFPHHVTGYTARTHALVKAIANEGWCIDVVTRPGYPHDRNDAQHTDLASSAQDVDGMVYTRLPAPPSSSTPFDQWCDKAADAIHAHIRSRPPAIVHAASNYVNAAPALIAARRARLPFVYEVRGLWELTNAARVAHWEGSERFQFQKDQEARVAREADAVIAISEGLRTELIARGVDERRITVVPNSVDPAMFQPRARDHELADRIGLGERQTLGFLGSMTGYEGLVDLVSALADLRKGGLDVCALLVGDGPAFREVREAARSLGVEDHLIMPGRVPHAEAPRWYSLMNVAVYPRRPARVTELVPPLKPLEAMSMELPVVASNVSAISETVVHRRNGYLFDKGDVRGLTRLLDEVIHAPEAARQVGQAARRDVQARFTWSRAAGALDHVYDHLAPVA